MSNITDSKMNLLSQLAYVDLPDRVNYKDLVRMNYTVLEMVNYYLDNEEALTNISDRCAMDKEEWRKTLKQIKKDSELSKLTIKGYTDQNKIGDTGLVAYCFETEDREAVIAYRGSETREGLSPKDWEDNFQIGFTDCTEQQRAALKFMEDMKSKYNYRSFKTTGHSKGGNNAQYVAIMSDDVTGCVSFDGPGFCDGFIVNNLLKIQKGKDKIVAYDGKNDIVSSLLFSVAGKIIIIDTEEQENFLHNHKPNLFLDENGNLHKETDKNIICNALKTYTMRVSTLLPDWAGLYLVDSVFNILDGEFNIKEAGGVCVGLLALPMLLKNAFIELSFLGVYYTGKAAIAYAEKKFEEFQQEINKVADKLLNELRNIKKDIAQLRDAIFSSVAAFLNQVRTGIREFYNFTAAYTNEPLIYVNISRLIYYANRLEGIKRQIAHVDRRLNSLYAHTDLFDLDNLFKADRLIGDHSKLNNCIQYLYKSAELLETAESRLLRQANLL